MRSDSAADTGALRGVNLNLVPVLCSLLSTCSVSATAQALHMSQSSVSDALARLRLHFRDELLLRRGRGMLLTPRARELAQPVNDVVLRLCNLLHGSEFDALSLRREFIVATADPVVMTIGGPLCQRLQQQAPQASVRFVDIHSSDYDRLRNLEVDLVIVPRGFLRTTQLIEVPIYKESFVCIARRDHPQVRGRITKTGYAKLPHASYRADAQASVSMEARLIGLEQQDVIKVPSFSLLPILVEQSDAIALVQRRIAERFAASARIQIIEPPVPIPPLDVCVYWSTVQSEDAAHAWFRELLIDTAAALS